MKQIFLLLTLVVITSYGKTIKVKVSVYYPSIKQCDSSYLITASNKIIDTNNLQRWVAISRNLHKRYGGYLSFGDTVFVSGINNSLNGYYIVNDLMNSRFFNKIDILCNKKYGNWRATITFGKKVTYKSFKRPYILECFKLKHESLYQKPFMPPKENKVYQLVYKSNNQRVIHGFYSLCVNHLNNKIPVADRGKYKIIPMK